MTPSAPTDISRAMAREAYRPRRARRLPPRAQTGALLVGVVLCAVLFLMIGGAP